MLSEAQRFWDAIVGKVRKVAQEVTKNTFRCERYTVTTAPNGTKMGVTLPMGSKEIMLPYSQEVASATVGSQVLVVWWGSMSNAKVDFFADGYSGNQWKMYTSVAQLGLTAGSATIAGAFSAMPANSILICQTDNMFASGELPSGFYGNVEIVKQLISGARSYIYAYGKLDTMNDYRMHLTTNNSVTGTWVRLPGKTQDGTVTKTFTDTFTNDTTWLQCDGHLAILNLQVRYSTAFGTDDCTDIYSVSPAPSKAVYSSFDFNGGHATVRIKTDGAVQILAHGSAYTQFARYSIPYFY